MQYRYLAATAGIAFFTVALVNTSPEKAVSYANGVRIQAEKFFIYNSARRELREGDRLMGKVMAIMDTWDRSAKWQQMSPETLDDVARAVLNYQEARKIIVGRKKPYGSWIDGCTPEMDEDEKDIRAHFYYGIGIGKKILGNNARFENNDVMASDWVSARRYMKHALDCVDEKGKNEIGKEIREINRSLEWHLHQRILIRPAEARET